MVRGLRAFAATARRLRSSPHLSRQLQPKLNVDRVAADVRVCFAGVDATHLEPQRDRILEVATQTRQRPSVRMHAPQCGNASDPIPRRITLDIGNVFRGAHICNHRFPRQGSRSRSIPRRVPPGRSRL